MEEILMKFEIFFKEEKKEEAVSYILEKLQAKEVDVLDLYSRILTPLLNNMDCELEDKRICIWKEHVKSGIARTIIECCYPFVIKKRKELNLPKKGNAVVLCPPEEYHELGARMAADFFTICGYETIFVGSNTPYQDFYHAIPVVRPEIVAISISDFYNLVAAKRMVEELKNVVDYQIKIIAGGHALKDDTVNKLKAIGADYYVNTYDDIYKLTKREVIT